MPVSAEARRAKDREYQRASRARKAAARAASPSAAPDRPDGSDASAVGPIERAVRAAVVAMKQLAESDQALVEVAYSTARQVDRLIATGDLMMSSRIFTGQQTLVRALHELGGTPTVRQQFEFRSRRVAPTKGPVSDGGDEQGSGTVSQFRRPEKRGRRKPA